MTKLICLQNDNGFYCDQCGLCCMNLDKNPILSDLDRGDGICKHFNQQTKLCEIYTNRPLV
ncbi:CxxCxxCC domain-containing protein [Mergibacter septicus]|uniref:hypothetical protein n=1 Tax=Mergibacter septicus TaxID=221402 RepID=UPI002240BB99|nr:hypothetical protein [Mergibacter septicus]